VIALAFGPKDSWSVSSPIEEFIFFSLFVVVVVVCLFVCWLVYYCGVEFVVWRAGF